MKKILAALLALILFSAPAQAAWFGSGNEDLVAIFGALDLDGPTDANVESLEGYVGSHPGEEGVDEALLRLARIYSDNKEYQKAAASYGHILEAFPGSKFKYEAAYELAAINYRTGRLKEAMSS
jgi:tetratricopeptide (TPR) repeat protein